MTLLVSSLILSSLTAAAPAGDGLWQRAVDLAQANKAWRAGRSVTRSEELDKNGRAKSVAEITLTHTTPRGKPELMRFLRNGVDVTEKERPAFTKRLEDQKAEKDDGPSIRVAGTPFDQQAQLVSIRRTGEQRLVEGRTCEVYEYVRRSGKEGNIKGTAFLDPGTGAPVGLVEQPDPLPRFVERMSIAMVFDYRGPTEWFLRRVVVEGAGGLLFIKKAGRSTVDFLDPYQAPRP